MITEETVSLQSKFYYDLSLPAQTNAPLLIAIHGYGAHKHYMMREAKAIAPKNFAIASLEGPYRFWREATDNTYKPAFGWLTEYKPEDSVELHQRFVLKVIESLLQNSKIDGSRIFLFGFSQACALNFRFAFTYPNTLAGVIGISGGIPSDLDSNEKYEPTKAEVLYLYGNRDEFYPPAKFASNDAALREYLKNYKSKEFNAEHKITDEMRKEIGAWLRDKV
ncbi:MAG: alpha/beta hydrolase [Pyrinomonadaceae bacterium]